jgi:hypothetical protein
MKFEYAQHTVDSFSRLVRHTRVAQEADLLVSSRLVSPILPATRL